jgi:hypothetical protein
MMTVPLGPPYLVDVNGDGLIDFMGFRDVAPATVSVYLGNGNFGYAHALDIPVPLPPAAPSQIINSFVGDLDLDGRTDIVLSMYPSGVYFPWIPSSVLACTNVLSSPTWTSTPSPGIRSRGYFFNEMFVRDINGDGFPDVVGSETGDLGTAFNSIPKTRVGALIGNGAGGFSSSMVIEVPGNTEYTNFGMVDFDSDGDPDFFGLDYPFFQISIIRNISRYGLGCSNAPFGAPIMSSNLLTPGNVGFQMRMGNAPPFSPCILAVSRGGFLGNNGACQIGVDFSPQNLILPLGSIGISMTDAFGFVAINLPIPPDPGLIGLTLFAQWGVVDPFAPGGIALTSAGTFIIW